MIKTKKRKEKWRDGESERGEERERDAVSWRKRRTALNIPGVG